MDRRSHSISPRRYRNGGGGGGGGSVYRRYSRSPRSRSRSCSRSRSRSRERVRNTGYRRRYSHSHSRERSYRSGNSEERDVYRDGNSEEYLNDHSAYGYSNRSDSMNYHVSRPEDNRRDEYYEKNRDRGGGGRDYERDRRRDHRRHGRSSSGRRYNSSERDRDSDDSEDHMSTHQFYNRNPSNTIIVLGLQSHITEADIMSPLIQAGMTAASIRLIRKRTTGASRGFAFVEFHTIDEAAHWMELTQVPTSPKYTSKSPTTAQNILNMDGVLVMQETCRATLQYSHSREQNNTLKAQTTDWYCGKCGIFNFKRRENCFKCSASREESERGGEGSDEISNILTKKIMLRNLDVLTNEEGVLTAIQHYAPDMAQKISKVLVSRDSLTQTSRGICYLHFDSLVDSMNLHNTLSTLEPPFQVDGRDIIVSYCMDYENRQMLPKKTESSGISSTATHAAAQDATIDTVITPNSGNSGQYTLADVPRLAEYSANLYATTPTEQTQYVKYYTDYYISEIKKGSFSNLPNNIPLTEANSGAAVALSAIQRKQKKMNSIETTATAAAAAAASAAAAVRSAIAAQSIVTPKGNDGKVYPTPDVSKYQYDETSGYYYDPTTGLYYDAHSQYYYNNETGAYLYWDQRKSTYLLAAPANTTATMDDNKKAAAPASEQQALSSVHGYSANEEASKKDKKEGHTKTDKVQVAKKIVKDMEKWAKQLNQRKDYTAVATPQPILSSSRNAEANKGPSNRSTPNTNVSSGYADLGFSILEKKSVKSSSNYVSPMAGVSNKLKAFCGSDSDEDNLAPTSLGHSKSTTPATSLGTETVEQYQEKDYVDFQKLTCLLCKRAFQSLEILQKHLKMSNLHKENLAKHNLNKREEDSNPQTSEIDSLAAALSYRDRAKERRQKYGECDPPPPNRSRERFESELSKMNARSAEKSATQQPINSNNVGSRLLQKMGWSEGQGLGRKNQGRTSIIEAETRNSTAGLGNSSSGLAPGDDYKTYIKKMMKSRYESV